MEAGTTPESIQAVLHVGSPSKGPERTRRFRCFAGFVPYMATIENRLVLSANMSSFPLLLGTAATDDMPDAEMLATLQR